MTPEHNRKKTPGRKSSRAEKKVMIAALEKTLGIVTAACKASGISRDKHYYWMNHDPIYKKAVEEIGEMGVDFAEGKLLESIKNGSDTATIFYLKTKGKARGYVEKTEVDANVTGGFWEAIQKVKQREK
jgi:hypothetical protein